MWSDGFEDYTIQRLYKEAASQWHAAQKLLEENGLDSRIPPYYVVITDASGKVVGGGGLDGNVIKCVAVDGTVRDAGLTNRIVSHLLAKARDERHRNVFVFTKPEYETVFRSLSFHTVGKAPKAILLESDPRGIRAYSDALRSLAREGRTGVAVMNCNPFTLGHLSLIERAARQVDHLYVIPLSDSRQDYPLEERREMMEQGTAHLGNVTICPSSDYLISRASFPTYFLKEVSAQSEAHMALDCDIFNRHIAPALGVSVRFVGTEPTDAMTRLYNETLPQRLQIEVVEMVRKEIDAQPISASRVRQAVNGLHLRQALAMVPPTTLPHLLAKSATEALLTELRLHPKPGLVTPQSNGSHKDMDFQVMARGIAALRPFFVAMAKAGSDAPTLKALGIKAEEAMLKATGGVNTHRGALFALGLAVAAAAQCLKEDNPLTLSGITCEISKIAREFAQPEATNGAEVQRKHKVEGALAMAQKGYQPLLGQWIEAYRYLKKEHPAEEAQLRTLLLIIATLGDSNLYHRGGEEGALFMQREARRLTNDYSPEALEALCAETQRRNLSPGGAADMLSLTLFLDSIIQ